MASGTSTVSTDSGSTTAEAWAGSGATDEAPAESNSGRRSSVVRTIRRWEVRASSRAVSSTSSQRGWVAAYPSRVL